jgi:hypothetical protein
MTRKALILLGLAGLPLWISCGGENPAATEYSRIKNLELPGENAAALLEEFELRWPGHFDSKVDLGTYYLALGETERAKSYLRRAEAALGDREGRPGRKKPGGAPAQDPKNIPIMYGALGQLHLSQGDYEKALEYTDKAIEAGGEGNQGYRFQKGHILAARKEYARALEVFDGLLREGGENSGESPEAKAEDLRAYLFLLAHMERSAEAAAVLDRYFETGAFFPSLGTFAATVYQAAGKPEMAAYALYLEQEYRSGYEAAAPGDEPGGLPASGYNFFAAEYLSIKNRIQNGALSEDQYRRYLELEPYFRLFPSYYWNLWLGARLLFPENCRNFAPALQKIIALDKDGPFAAEAWKELTRLLGY